MAAVTDTRPPRVEAGPGTRHRVLLVGSGGGHLAQLRRLAPWWSQHDRLWVTFDLPCAADLAGDRVVWAHHPTTRNLRNLARNALLAWRVVRDERPDVVLSTGAGVALPFFLVARLHGIRTVYLEVYDRIDSRTLTGRLCRPLSDLFLLQWERQREAYGAGTVVGTLY